jgi:hypothetical protein
MKHTLAVLMGLLCSSAHTAPLKVLAPLAANVATPKPSLDPVAEFELIVSSASDPRQWSKVFRHSKNGKWAKQYYSLGQVKFDVWRTDSLVSPAMGLVNFPIEVTQSEFLDTQAEAEQSSSLSKLKVTYFMTGKYLLDDGAWHVDRFSYYAAVGDRAPDPTTVSEGRQDLLDGLKAEAGIARMIEKWIR